VGREPGRRALVEFECVYRSQVDELTAYFARRCAEPRDVADLTSETVLQAAAVAAGFRAKLREWC
jgi:DNA-directed RNA polymerase specialized sigma24 family protein